MMNLGESEGTTIYFLMCYSVHFHALSIILLIVFFQPNKCQISDAQKIQYFIESYELGTRVLKGKYCGAYCFK